eukprot:c18464_g1_i1 orf=1-879(-)
MDSTCTSHSVMHFAPAANHAFSAQFASAMPTCRLPSFPSHQGLRCLPACSTHVGEVEGITVLFHSLGICAMKDERVSGVAPQAVSSRAVALTLTASDPATCLNGLLNEKPANPPTLKKVSATSLQYEAGYLGGISSKTSGEGLSTALSYLTRILSSKVYDVAIESPLEIAEKLSERIGAEILLKREDLQPVFSFKLRGAYNMMAQLPKEQLSRGVICSSAGNHAQGVALAAQRLGCDAVIAMPLTTPDIKWKSVKRLGATVVLIGDSYDETQAYAKQRAEEEGRVFVPPFDHP